MNDILNRGFVSPYIKFNFLRGSIETTPHAHFVSLTHNRSVEQASTFELTLIYVPGTHGETYAEDMHQLLLTSVNHPVTFHYGYITPDGGLQLQEDVWYRGIYTQYTENLGNDGTLTYTISGVAESVSIDTPKVEIENYLNSLKRQATGAFAKRKPSLIVKHLITQEETMCNMKKYFDGYEIIIDPSDEDVDVQSINIKDGTLREVLCGSYKSDGTTNVKGFANHSYINLDKDTALQYGIITERDISLAESYQNKGSNTYSRNQRTQDEEKAANLISNLKTMPFVCYFDDVVTAEGSASKGKFYYIPKYTKQYASEYIYNFGNNFIDSDVLSFSVNNDCIVAMASVGSLNSISSGIGNTGESIAASHNVLQQTSFSVNSFNTITGFDESRFLTQTALSNALNFPFTATMTVVGQTKLNHLMDKIRVTIMFNGSINELLTGDYIIMGITDELSDSGYTTTFDLQKDIGAESFESDEPEIFTNEENSAEEEVEKAYANDYK